MFSPKKNKKMTTEKVTKRLRTKMKKKKMMTMTWMRSTESKRADSLRDNSSVRKLTSITRNNTNPLRKKPKRNKNMKPLPQK